jgi:hypothetical protein
MSSNSRLQPISADSLWSICFTVEAIIRVLAAPSFKLYICSAWNLFDLVILFLGYIGSLTSGSTQGISALRAFRALRVMLLFKSFRDIVNAFFSVRFHF